MDKQKVTELGSWNFYRSNSDSDGWGLQWGAVYLVWLNFICNDSFTMETVPRRTCPRIEKGMLLSNWVYKYAQKFKLSLLHKFQHSYLISLTTLRVFSPSSWRYLLLVSLNKCRRRRNWNNNKRDTMLHKITVTTNIFHGQTPCLIFLFSLLFPLFAKYNEY